MLAAIAPSHRDRQRGGGRPPSTSACSRLSGPVPPLLHFVHDATDVQARGGVYGRARARRPVLSGCFEGGNRGDALLGLAVEAGLYRHAGHERVTDEAVGALLGVPNGRESETALGRPGSMVDLALGSPF